MLLAVKLVILITMVTSSVKQIMRGYSIVGRLPDTLVLKLGAWVMLHRNIDIDSGWINGMLAVVTALTDNCIVVHKLANIHHLYPVPWFRQKFEIYSIMHQQFPIQLAYGVTDLQFIRCKGVPCRRIAYVQPLLIVEFPERCDDTSNALLPAINWYPRTPL